MKLAFCIFKYFPYGGQQRDFLQFYHMACERGYDVRVYCSDWQGPKPNNLDLVIVPVGAISNQAKTKHFAWFLLEHLQHNPVDLVVGFNKMPGLDVYFAADACFEARAQEERSWLYRIMPRYKYYARAEKAVFQSGQKTKILLISETEKEKFIRYYQTEEERMTLLPPGISEDRKAPENAQQRRAAFRNEHQLKAKDRVLLFVASAFVTKGLDRAITALASLPEQDKKTTQLMVIGEDKQQRFVELAAKLGVAGQVKYFGSREDVLDFYLGADCLVHPARTEAAGIVLIEALVAGLPIVVTEICGYANHVQQADAGIVIGSPFSQIELNRALGQALDPDRQQQWRNNALDYAGRADLYNKHKVGMAVIDAELTRKLREQGVVAQGGSQQ